MTTEDNSHSANKAGNFLAGGLASAGAYNALFARDKERGWKALGLVALFLGFFYSIWVYFLSIKNASSYESTDKWKVIAIPPLLYVAWYYVTGLYIWISSTTSISSSSMSGWGLLWFIVLPLTTYVWAGYATWSYLGKIHSKYGNGQVSFWKHLLCAISILFLSFGFWSNKAMYAPHSTFWATQNLKDEYDVNNGNAQQVAAARDRLTKRQKEADAKAEEKRMKDPVYVARKAEEAKRKAIAEEQTRQWQAHVAKQREEQEAKRQAEAEQREQMRLEYQREQEELAARREVENRERIERQYTEARQREIETRERRARLDYEAELIRQQNRR